MNVPLSVRQQLPDRNQTAANIQKYSEIVLTFVILVTTHGFIWRQKTDGHGKDS